MPDTDLLASFALDLRKLRAEAGSPTYRELARRSHYAASTLAEALSGRRLPTLPVTVAFVRSCGGDVAAWEQRWRALAAELAADTATPEADDAAPAPYAGLAPFQPEDAARFFGRDKDIRQLAELLTGRRFVAVFGASGVGKSSLLRAGLVPVLRERGPVLVLTPGRLPVEELAVQLAALTGGRAAQLCTELAGDADRLHLAVRQHLAGTDEDLVLVVDQFEEVFTLCADPVERERFLAALLHAVGAETSRVRVVLGVRTDFFGHCAAHPELAAAIQESQLLLTPMTADQLREAVTRPATEAGYRLENALLATIMAETAGAPGVLPLVSHALLETWRRRHGTLLTLHGYQAAGGIAHAIARTAEGVHDELDESQRAVLKALFLRLTALGEGTEDTKRRVRHAELDDTADTRLVLERLTQARLITVDQGGLEISHEALIRCWPRLREWLAADRDGLRVHRALTEAAETWDTLDRDPATLYRGSRLDQAAAWAKVDQDSMSRREREFLAASRQAAEEEQSRTRRRRRRQSRLVAAVVVFALLAASTAITAMTQWQSAAEQRDEATYRHALAQADRLATTDPALSARLTLALHRMRPDDESVHTRLLSTRNQSLAISVPAHRTPVFTARYRHDGKIMVSTGDDGAVRLWDTSDPLRPRLLSTPLGDGPLLTTAVFSPDGSLLVAVGHGGRVLLWRVTDPANPQSLGQLPTDSSATVLQVAFHPGGTRLITTHDGGPVREWDLRDPASPRAVEALRAGNAVAVSYSPDGRTLATGYDSGEVRLWQDGAPPRVLRGHTDNVRCLRFSPSGRELASCGRDGTVRLWRLADGAQLGLPLGGHTGGVWSATYNHDGTLMVTTSSGGTAQLWNMSDPERPMRLGPALTSGGRAFFGTSFTPDSGTLAIAGEDGRIHLWSLPTALLIGHGAQVDSIAVNPARGLAATGDQHNKIILWSFADPARPRRQGLIPAPAGDKVCANDCLSRVRFSPDGNLLVVLTNSGLVRLWDISDPAAPKRLSEMRLSGMFSTVLALSSDGRTMVVNEQDSVPRLWDISDPSAPRRLGDLGHGAVVGDVEFQPGGTLVATSSFDRTIRLWDVSNPHAPALRASIAAVGTLGWLAFSPDGRTLADTSEEPLVRFWDVHDPTQPRRLPTPMTGHTKLVTGLVWHDQTAATAAADQTIRLWRTNGEETPEPFGGPIRISGNAGAVLAYLPDGRHLLVGDGTNTVQVLDLDLGRAVERICRSTQPVDEDRWRQLLPDLPYQPTCGAG